MVLVTFACYVSYAPFDVWWYLRFLLPGFGALSVLIAAGAVTLARSIPQPWGRLIAAAAILLLAVKSVTFAAAASTFGPVRDGEQRYIAMGEFAAAHLPVEAVVFAVQHSGAMRFYGGRYTLRFDQLVSEPADRLIDQLERAACTRTCWWMTSSGRMRCAISTCRPARRRRGPSSRACARVAA